ncbi:hypothetical protein [Kitasatospora sp. NPDC058046]|uniref:hypothetical protein n=1 Tax=Kitasatospora sp. NPDC058046 TaxID=3346312 RepID=UPI0036D9FA20
MIRSALMPGQATTAGHLPDHADHRPTRAVLHVLSAAGLTLARLTDQRNDTTITGAFAWPSLRHGNDRAADIWWFVNGEKEEQPDRSAARREATRAARNAALDQAETELAAAGYRVYRTESRRTQTRRVLHLTAMMPTPKEAARLRERRAKLNESAARIREPQISVGQ